MPPPPPPPPPRVSMTRFIARLSFIATLGGLSALAAISRLCTTVDSASAYCSSATALQDRVLAAPACAPECVDSAHAAEVIHSHLQHVHFMMDLLEGTGGLGEARPSVVLDARVFEYVARDAERKALLDNLTAFSVLREDARGRFERFLSADFAVEAGFIIRDFKYAIGDLNATAGYEIEGGGSVFSVRGVGVVDDALRGTLGRLVESLQLRFALLAPGVPALLDVVSQVHAHGRRISEELEAEIPRVREAYESIPWWQSIEILGGGSQRKVFTAYHEFLEAKAACIRERVGHAEVVHEHFAMLGGYLSWYADGPPGVSGVVEAGRVRSVARLWEVVEDLEDRMSSIGSAEMPVHRFTCPTRLQLP